MPRGAALSTRAASETLWGSTSRGDTAILRSTLQTRKGAYLISKDCRLKSALLPVLRRQLKKSKHPAAREIPKMR